MSTSPPLQSYMAHSNNVTISGFSMGAFLATNIATIYSSHFTGVGVIAGGAYGLSDIWDFENRNMDDTALAHKVQKIVNESFQKHEIDDPKYLKKHRVYCQVNTGDTNIWPRKQTTILKFYENLGASVSSDTIASQDH